MQKDKKKRKDKKDFTANADKPARIPIIMPWPTNARAGLKVHWNSVSTGRPSHVNTGMFLRMGTK